MAKVFSDTPGYCPNFLTGLRAVKQTGGHDTLRKQTLELSTIRSRLFIRIESCVAWFRKKLAGNTQLKSVICTLFIIAILWILANDATRLNSKLAVSSAACHIFCVT